MVEDSLEEESQPSVPQEDSQPEPISNPEPSILSQRLFDDVDNIESTLELLMGGLEESLPEVPLPPVEVPQALASKDGGPPLPAPVDKEVSVPRQPVPTPCRGQRGETAALKKLPPHEDIRVCQLTQTKI